MMVQLVDIELHDPFVGTMDGRSHDISLDGTKQLRILTNQSRRSIGENNQVAVAASPISAVGSQDDVLSKFGSCAPVTTTVVTTAIGDEIHFRLT